MGKNIIFWKVAVWSCPGQRFLKKFCDIIFLENISKLVKFTVQKTHFSRFFLVKKLTAFFRKNHWGHRSTNNGYLLLSDQPVACQSWLSATKSGLCHWTHIIILNEVWKGKLHTIFDLSVKSSFSLKIKKKIYWISYEKIYLKFNVSCLLGLEITSMHPWSLRASQEYK
jgi:hypothetical protein